MITKRPSKPAPSGRKTAVRKPAPRTALTKRATKLDAAELDAAILRYVRRYPNREVDLAPLAAELGIEPVRIQLAVEDLGRRRLVVVPFIEPGPAGGATLSNIGLRWLIAREGGKPTDKPEALKIARRRVRAEDEGARLPRAEVYGPRRG